jgi:cytochrome P450
MVDVLERTIFSDGFGRDPDEVRAAMSYFDTVGRIDPFDILGLPSVVPRPTRMKLKLTLRFFEKTVDDIIAMRQQRIPPTLHRDILTLLLEARDPDTGAALSDVEVRCEHSNVHRGRSGSDSQLHYLDSVFALAIARMAGASEGRGGPGI